MFAKTIVCGFLCLQVAGDRHSPTATVKEPKVLAICEWQRESGEHQLKLVLVETVRAKPNHGRRVSFRVYDEGTDGSQPENPRRILADIPDIPTHDRVGAPESVRAGAVYWDAEKENLYIAIAKSIGSRLIMRVYRAELPLVVTGDVDMEFRQVAQIEDHEVSSDQPVRQVTIELNGEVLMIVGRSAQQGEDRRSFEFDLGGSTLRRTAKR